MRTLGLSIYYQILMSLRTKQALFFSVFFPVFLFILFGNLWGADDNSYVFFILTGILGMNIATEGIYAIGPVIKGYYSGEMIKYFRKLPLNILVHFSGLIVSRFLSLFVITILLFIISRLMFGHTFTTEQLLDISLGMMVGIFLFSFLGLVVSFAFLKTDESTGQKGGLSNIIYYIVIFTSDAFYPVGLLNPLMQSVSNWLPMNPILNIMRGDEVNWVAITLWLSVSVVWFSYLFKKFQSTR